MFHRLAVSSLAIAGLIAMATAPAEAGQSTGSWKYWDPNSAYAAPPAYWNNQRYSAGYRQGGHGHPEYQVRRGGYNEYPPRQYGQVYRHHHHRPVW